MEVKFAIKFPENPSAIFEAGKLMEGVVEMDVFKTIQATKIALRLCGSALAEWHQVWNRYGHTQTCRQMGYEKYLDTNIDLLNSHSVVEFQPGKYVFNFMSVLPADTPMSVDEAYGHVRYTATLHLERPRKIELKHRVRFHVIRPTDLNLVPALKMRFEMDLFRTFGFLCFKTMPMSMRVTMPMTGLLPGQCIDIRTDIINPTRVTVKCIDVSFLKIVKYSSDYPCVGVKEEVQEISRHCTPGIVRYGAKSFVMTFNVPQVHPSTNNACRIVDISYQIHVKCRVAGFYTGPLVKIPVVIGNIPYTNGELVDLDSDDNDSFVSRPPRYSAVADHPPAYGDIEKLLDLL